MARSRFRHFIRDDRETELCAEYTVSGGEVLSGMYRPPEHYDPGSPPEVEIEECWIDGSDLLGAAYAIRINLTDKEAERFEMEVIEDPDTWEYNDDYDY